jgi:hypothetical protein
LSLETPFEINVENCVGLTPHFNNDPT